jgi:GTP cyclohydrolase FolE2
LRTLATSVLFLAYPRGSQGVRMSRITAWVPDEHVEALDAVAGRSDADVPPGG